jgi:hypothetical protein
MSLSYVKIFNEVLDEFLTELMEIFPENKSINVTYTLFQTIVKVNVKKPCDAFMTKIIPYLEKIAMRDEDILVGPDRPEILNKLKIDQRDLNTLSDNTKQALWKYITSFIAIGFKIIEMPQETHQIINYIITR